MSKAARSALLLCTTGMAVAVVACGDQSSNIDVPPLQVTTATTGDQLDPDGYAVSVNGADPMSVGVNDTLIIGDASPGPQVVELSGVAPNCVVQGSGTDTVTVAAGATASANFQITCAAVQAGDGQVQVTASTTGSSLDPDGYDVLLDGRRVGTVAAQGSATLGGVAAGSHTVGLDGIAPNCQPAGDNPQNVAVVADSTVMAPFAITCATGSSGSIAKWTSVRPPNTALMFDVWGSSSSDFWAVGTDRDGGNAGVIEHYDGGQWSEQVRLPDIQLDAVWGSGPDDVYAVGGHNASPAGAIVHYDGQSWTEISGPSVASPGDTLVLWQSIFGLSAHDIYVVGAGYSPTLTPLAAHFDGTQWTTFTLPNTVHHELLDVWASSPQDVFVSGVIRDPATGEDTSNDLGLVLHFDGATWTETTQGGPTAHLKAVWGTGPSNVYIVGDPGVILHWDGSAWHDGPRLITAALHEIWGSGPDNVYAVAARGFILRFDGTSWSKVDSPVRLDLFGLWGSGPTDAWSVGRKGVIVHGTP